jgi:hypothetical protein
MAAGTAAELFSTESIELVDGNAVMWRRIRTQLTRDIFGNSADVILRSAEVRIRLRAHPARIPNVGMKVSFSVPAESCIVFPA